MNHKITIPKSFMIGPHEIKVSYSKDMLPTKQLAGDCNSFYNTIRLAENDLIPQTQVEQSFYHEKIHMILDNMERKDLSSEEDFVDLFAMLLLQSDKTANYED